ncbi:hypothetical protein KY348_02865 [Candidatus Woesearchaeota archaeon]|nr:hypothetical protein [Candidatus Woesearchaeota archaeon]
MPRKTKNNKRKRKKRGRPPKKKTRRKKTTRRTVVTKNAPKKHYFILCNGMPVRNVKELADLMDKLEEQVFNHHVRADGNDFANWVKDIFKDIELAEKMAGTKDKKHMQLVIYKHITHKLW